MPDAAWVSEAEGRSTVGLIPRGHGPQPLETWTPAGRGGGSPSGMTHNPRSSLQNRPPPPTPLGKLRLAGGSSPAHSFHKRVLTLCLVPGTPTGAASAMHGVSTGLILAPQPGWHLWSPQCRHRAPLLPGPQHPARLCVSPSTCRPLKAFLTALPHQSSGSRGAPHSPWGAGIFRAGPRLPSSLQCPYGTR